MKQLVFLISLSLVACAKPVDKPNNLVPKETMAAIIADFAVAEQLSFSAQQYPLEQTTQAILKKYNTSGKDFADSYKYYLVTKSMDGILNRSSKIIEEKDPAAKEFINKKNTEAKAPQ